MEVSKKNVDIAIMIPLKEEYNIFVQCLGEFKFTLEDFKTKRGEFYILRIGKVTCIVQLMGEIGTQDATSATHLLLNVCAPKIIINAGCGGSISDDVKLLDVVVGKQIDLWADRAAVVGKAEMELKLAGKVFQSNDSVVRIAEALPRKDINKALFATFVEKIHKKMEEKASKELVEKWRAESKVREADEAGDIIVSSDIACSDVVGKTVLFGEWLKKRNRKYGCIEMEGGGIATALHKVDENIKLLALRGITDKADELKNAMPEKERKAFRYCGIYNVMQFLLALLQSPEIQDYVNETREREDEKKTNEVDIPPRATNLATGKGGIAQANGPVTQNFN